MAAAHYVTEAFLRFALAKFNAAHGPLLCGDVLIDNTRLVCSDPNTLIAAGTFIFRLCQEVGIEINEFDSEADIAPAVTQDYEYLGMRHVHSPGAVLTSLSKKTIGKLADWEQTLATAQGTLSHRDLQTPWPAHVEQPRLAHPSFAVLPRT